jgi:hypothetical protein
VSLTSVIRLSILHGQTSVDSTILREIDAQVWYPFIRTFGAFDADGFNALHSNNVLRAGPWGMRHGAEYFESNVRDNARNMEAGITRAIALTFEYRVHTADTGYEVGYYRVRSTRDGITRSFYGQFHVVLKKIDGAWKIAQDWDANIILGVAITEDHFLQHSPKGLYE